MALDVGREAPDFTLRDTDGAMVKLSDFRGEKYVLLVFVPFALTRTCTAEFCQLRDENADMVNDPDVEVLGISCDPAWVLREWKKKESYINTFLSDFWPHGDVSKAYDAFDEIVGAPMRCTFLVDKDGILRFVEYNTLQTVVEARDQARWREALAALR
jgi:peroxiredoxin (alkyl hydroperoxide reductase subunit C)